MSAKTSKKATPAPVSLAHPNNARLSRGRARDEAIFPAPAALEHMPADYGKTLEDIKRHLRQSRVRAVMAANPLVIEAYWHVGHIILARQRQAAWGAKVIDRLAADLQAAFADMSGLSSRNLLSMKLFAQAFPDGPIAKQLVSQLPWGQIIRLLQLVKDPTAREFYIRQCLAQGWSRGVLELQIKSQLHLRQAKATNNFSLTMPPEQSDMATEIFKDPYLFDFLGTADPRREAEVEQALVDHIQKFFIELGAGFAFVGRQVPLEVGDQDFKIDLLFYHLRLRRYVIIELKARPFSPADVGQLNLYLSAADDLLRHPDDQPSIGLILCRSKNRLVAEYALRGLDQSIAVASWEAQLTASLPEEFRGSLPSIEEIEAEFQNDPLPRVEAPAPQKPARKTPAAPKRTR